MAAKTSKKKKNEKEPIKNIVTIKDTGPCKKQVSIEVPEETVQAKLEEQYKDISRDAVVPGFRKGRAPMRLIVKRFGDDVRQQVKLKILAESSDDAMKDNELDPLTDPDIDYQNIDLPENGSMKYEFEIEVRPDFKLPELKKIEVEKVKIETDEKQIDEQIEMMRKRAGIWTPKDGKVEEDDQIIGDVLIKTEGQEDDKQDNTEIFVRKSGFVGGIPVDNLSEVLDGLKAGDSKSTTVEISKTFFKEEYRGKKVELSIHIKEVKKLVPAELNEEFFSRFGVEDINELKDSISEMRQAQAEQEARTAMGDQVYNYLLENTDFDLPENIVADQSTRILQRRYSQMLMQGLQREQIDEQMEDLRASSDEQAYEQLKLFFIMDKIATQLDIEVSEEEINGHIAQAAAQRGRRPEKMREELARDGSLAQFRLQVREQKCIEKLLEDAEIKEVDAKNAKKTTKKKTTKKATAKKTTKKKTTKKASKDKDEPKTPKKVTKKKKTTKKKKED